MFVVTNAFLIKCWKQYTEIENIPAMEYLLSSVRTMQNLYKYIQCGHAVLCKQAQISCMVAAFEMRVGVKYANGTAPEDEKGLTTEQNGDTAFQKG